MPVAFTLLDAHGRTVRETTATLLVNGRPAVPQGDPRLATPSAAAVTATRTIWTCATRGLRLHPLTLVIRVSDGKTHTFTPTVRRGLPNRAGADERAGAGQGQWPRLGRASTISNAEARAAL